MNVAPRLSWLPLLRGLLAVRFGVLALVWPGATVLALLFAAYAVVDGVGMIASGLGQEGDRGRRWLYLLAGAVGVIAGAVILARPDIGALALATVLGVYALLAGVLLLVAGWRLRQANVVVLRI